MAERKLKRKEISRRLDGIGNLASIISVEGVKMDGEGLPETWEPEKEEASAYFFGVAAGLAFAATAIERKYDAVRLSEGNALRFFLGALYERDREKGAEL